MSSTLNVNIEWIAWSSGGGVAKERLEGCCVRPSTRVGNLWDAVSSKLQSAPTHHSRLWCVRGGRFMHDISRTVESYGLTNGDTLYVVLRSAEPLISG